MGLTIGSLSQYYYSQYELSTNTEAQENAIDESKISSEKYNVENLSNALSALQSVDSVNFSYIGNVKSFADNVYSFSQLSIYDKLKGDSSVFDFLSGSTDLSSVYDSMNDMLEWKQDIFISSLKEEDSSTDSTNSTASASGYESYLSSGSVSSLLDLFV